MTYCSISFSTIAFNVLSVFRHIGLYVYKSFLNYWIEQTKGRRECTRTVAGVLKTSYEASVRKADTASEDGKPGDLAHWLQPIVFVVVRTMD